MTPSRLLTLCLAVSVVAALWPAAVADARFFRSPSANVGCFLTKKTGVRCDIRKHKWDPPRKPRWCDLDWGEGLTVGKHGRAKFVCAGDTVLNAEAPPLPRGESIERGRFRCRSKRTGMRCVNKRTQHGFKLSRLRARRF